MNDGEKIRVLFVCMGNICRSPTAHGVLDALIRSEGLADRIEVDSAGTHAYHVGKQPDQRAQQVAVDRGLDLNYQRARQTNPLDFDEFDYVLAMDTDNYEILRGNCPEGQEHKLRRFLEFAPQWGKDVPDPYYGGVDGFDRVFDMVQDASQGLLDHLRSQHSL